MWHCSLAIFFSLMKTELASLTEYLGFGDRILDVFIKKEKKTIVEKEKTYLGKEQKAELVLLPPLPPMFEGFRNELIKACFVTCPFSKRMSFLYPTYKHI